jgi:hypothetical protein
MKKFLSLVFVLAMVFSVAACGEKTTTTKTQQTTTTTAPVKPTLPAVDAVTAPAEGKLRLGMGVVVNFSSTKATNGQIDATVVTTVINHEGKIVAARLDAVQNVATIGEEITVKKLEKTKMELGNDYGMAGKVDNNGDGIKLEWFEQAKAYETYLVGKTLNDVKAFDLQYVNGHWISTDNSLLTAGCTIQVADFNLATLYALTDAQGFEFDAVENFTLGVAATSFNDGSEAATDDKDGTLKLYTDFAASVVAEGKIVATLNDAIQPSITFDVDGEIIETKYTNTKRVLKEAYNMAAYGQSMDWNGDGIVKEWYLQSEAFSKYVVGKTAQEVADMPTQVVEGSGYVISSEADLLAAGCTIQITSIKAVVAKSVNNAR